MLKKKSNKEFIEELKMVQPSLIVRGEYVNTDTKILIEDENGIQYNSTPFKLLQGKKPSILSAINKNIAFETLSKLRHGDKYDYSKVDYKNSSSKVKIICKDHGIFQQIPGGHLSGKGCKKCSETYIANKRRMTNGEFIKKSKKVHGEQFDYLTEYINGSTKIRLICKKHQETFDTMPYSHLGGAGCQKCKKEKISKAAKARNYGWSKTDWIKLSKEKPHYNPKIYLIECYNEKERFIKIGRTLNEVSVRFLGKREMPYSFKTILTLEGDAGYIFDLENRIKNIFKKQRYIPKKTFNGINECFLHNSKEEILNTLSKFRDNMISNKKDV